MPRNDNVVAQALKNLAVVLMRLGINAPRAEKLLRAAFVHAALSNASAQRTSANQSQIAMITGVNRLDVRKVLRKDSVGSGIPQSQRSRLDLVLTAWRTDPDFRDSKGRPRPLSYKGRTSAFSKLVTKYGRDVTSKSILDQLVRTRAVKEKSGKLIMTRIGNGDSADAVAARADLKFLEAQLRDLRLGLGRRVYVSRSSSLIVRDQKTAKRLQRTMLQRIQVMLSGLGAMSGLERKAATRKSYRVVATTNVAIESGKESDEN